MQDLTKQTKDLISWARGDLREMYIATDRRKNLDWRICQVHGKRPGDIRIIDCVPVADFPGPRGTVVANSFTSKTDALRVSEHLCRPLEQTRSEDGSWGCWNWKDKDGTLVSQLCISVSGETDSRSTTPSDQPSTITIHGELPDAILSKKARQIYEVVLQCAHEVHSELGCGHAEKAYENALASKLRTLGYHVEQQVPVAGRAMDIVIDGKVIVETKQNPTWVGRESLKYRHLVQSYRYCVVGKLELCILINFGCSPLEHDFVTCSEGN